MIMRQLQLSSSNFQNRWPVFVGLCHYIHQVAAPCNRALARVAMPVTSCLCIILSLFASRRCWLNVVVCYDIVCCRRHVICRTTVDISTSARVVVQHWRDSSVSTYSYWRRQRSDKFVWGTRWDCNSCWVAVIRPSVHFRSWYPAESVSSVAFGRRW